MLGNGVNLRMTLAKKTGCGRALRSHNGKTLDIKHILFPRGDGLEINTKKEIKKYIKCGNITATLDKKNDLSSKTSNIIKHFFCDLLNLNKNLSKVVIVLSDPLRLDTLVSVPSVSKTETDGGLGASQIKVFG